VRCLQGKRKNIRHRRNRTTLWKKGLTVGKGGRNPIDAKPNYTEREWREEINNHQIGQKRVSCKKTQERPLFQGILQGEGIPPRGNPHKSKNQKMEKMYYISVATRKVPFGKHISIWGKGALRAEGHTRLNKKRICLYPGQELRSISGGE